MTPTEIIEDKYYKYKFHFVSFPDNLRRLHGYIDGMDIYINKDDPIEKQTETCLHEVVHAECDTGNNLMDHKSIKTGRAEFFANHIASRDVRRYLA
ncbi:MAG: ImmA/IrrE family metallo-endopeptidase [Oenococcus oeni]